MRKRKLKVELRQEGGYWSVYVNGVRTVDRESFSVADRIKQELERPTTRHTEAGEVAESIRKHFARNPSRSIRSTRRNPSGVRIVYNRLLGGWYIVRGLHQTPLGGRFNSREEAEQHLIDQQNRRDARYSYVPGSRRNPSVSIRGMGPPSHMKHLRGRARHVSDRFPGIADHYYVQVKRGAAWIALASFGNNLNGKARATEYGKLLARRYPRQKFRVFWPDATKNPRRRDSGLSIVERHQLKVARQTLAMNDPMLAVMGGPTKAQAREIIRRLTRRKNPAPLASRVNGAEVDRAARLFQSFTGHRVTRARQVNLPRPRVGLAIGPVLGISYATTRDGKRENYHHDFRRGARPLLAASQDGRTLLLLSGAYRFTSRGIVDRA